MTLVLWIESIGAAVLRFIEQTGHISKFFAEAVRWLPRSPFRFKLFLEQFLFVANKSLFIVCLTAVFSGMVFAIQIYFGFQVINADALVGPSVAIGFVRELGPVFTGIVVTGRAGAAMAAQLGTMRVSEQIDAMDVMGVNSIHYLVVPRIVASFIALPLLCTLFIFVGNVGSYFTGVYLLNIDPIIYFSHLQEFVEPRDMAQGLIKASAFGLIFSTIGTFKGYFTQGGAEAVGRSTNEAVVITLVLILVSDYFLTLVIRAMLYQGV
ncbi:MAG TPA: ABC transporter permease [Oligoflexia bacterium]|nr:ABC transporter permease [Oligoflexia bacterium]